MGNLVTLWVEQIRALPISDKARKANPDRFVTVVGTAFYPTIEDPKTHELRADTDNPFTYHSKIITNDMALAEGYNLDLATGFVTIPEGQRGRPVAEGLSPDALMAQLTALREAQVESEDTSEPTEPTV